MSATELLTALVRLAAGPHALKLVPSPEAFAGALGQLSAAGSPSALARQAADIARTPGLDVILRGRNAAELVAATADLAHDAVTLPFVPACLLGKISLDELARLAADARLLEIELTPTIGLTEGFFFSGDLPGRSPPERGGAV